MERENEIRIRQLLDSYFEGETSLAEERELRAYFASAADIPADLRYAEAMFGALGGSAEAVLAAEGFTPRAAKRSLKPGHRVWLLGGIAAAAAAIAVAVIFPFHTASVQPQTVYCYINGEPVTDYQTALRYTEGTLELVGTSLDKSIAYLQQMETLDKSLDALKFVTLLEQSLEAAGNEE